MTPAAPAGPTFLGIDLYTAATILSAVATFAVLIAIYAATTVRDPMARRVKALNERREQLKAGIVASTSKRRKSISNRNELADKVRQLLKLSVDLGEGSPRQVVAGIAKAYRPEELVGTQVVVVANLKPAKLMGLESQGMVLAATLPDGAPVLLRPLAAVPVGARVK